LAGENESLQETPTHTEKELLMRVAQSDQKAFSELFRKWSVWLSRYIFRLTQSAPMAEEVVQDVFLTIWTHRKTLSGINNFKASLLVVSRNQAYMALRRKIREQTQFKAYEVTVAAATTSDPEQEYFSALDEAIESLAPRTKEVYILSRQQRLTYQEIADKLGISRETVKTYLERATGSITRFLKAKFPELGVFASIVLKNFM
jgi:RNA polymerase sigma-70 factor (ECF subfamily)